MNTLENTLTSQEVAEMLNKKHSELLKDIRRYIKQFNEGNLPYVEFFRESTYIDRKGELRPCYKITLKGCEFIAHKLTGVKGTIFTAKYINRFHEMQDIISQRQQEERPWYIRDFRGKYIILQRDFIKITGLDNEKHKILFRIEYFIGGRDFNGWGWKCNNEEFKKEYGFDYGKDNCMMYLYLCGAKKAIDIIEGNPKIKTIPNSMQTIQEGIRYFEGLKEKKKESLKDKETPDTNIKPIQIIINSNNTQVLV